VIEAQNGSVVELNAGIVLGGTLATAGSGVIRSGGGTFVMPLLSGVTNTGTYQLRDGRGVRIFGDSTNTGTMGIRSFGTGRIEIDSGRTLFNTGILGATLGTLQVTGGALDNTGGSIAVSAFSRVLLGPTTNFTNFSAATGTLTGGTYLVSGTFQFANANIVHNAANIGLAGLAGLGFGLSGGRIIDQFDQDALRNFRDNSGSFTLSNMNLTTPRAFANSGAMNINSGTFTSTGGSYTQTGGVTTVHGTLAAATVNIGEGLLQGRGIVNGNVNNNANVGPGTSPGLLTVNGDYTQSLGGHLLIELAGLSAGTLYDVLDVKGNATLAGSLDVDLLGGFDPTADAFFDVLLADEVAGTFDTVNLPTSSKGVFSIAYVVNPTGLDAVRIIFDFDDGLSPPSPDPSREDLPLPGVPEPSTIVMTAVGLVVMVLARRRPEEGARP
jgi:hypothetical protein